MQIRVQGKLFPITTAEKDQNDQLPKLWVLGDSPEWKNGQPVFGRQGNYLSVSTSPTAASLAMASVGEESEGKLYLRAAVDVALLAAKTGLLPPPATGSELFTKEHRAAITARPLSSNIMEINIQTLE
jgi:hypothetical protein